MTPSIPVTAPLLRPRTTAPNSPVVAPTIAPIQADNTRIQTARQVVPRPEDPHWVCTNCYQYKGDLYVRGAEGTEAHWECVGCDKTEVMSSAVKTPVKEPEPIKPIRIALGVQDNGELFKFAAAPNIQALPYTNWAELGIDLNDQTPETFKAALLKLGNMPNVEFHFNLTVPGKGLVNDPVNLKSNANKVTTAEYIFISTHFPTKTTFYKKSGTIYKKQ